MAPRLGRALGRLRLGHRLFKRCDKNDHSGQPRRESGICDVCDACLQGTAKILRVKRPRSSFKSYRHHTSVESFGSAVSSSCPFCLGLWNRYMRRPVESALSPNFKSDWSAFIEREKLGHCDFDIHRPIECGQGVSIILCMSLGDSSSLVVFVLYANSLLSPPIHTTNTGAPEALQIAKGWLTSCQEGHPQCSQTDVWYPTRLLHIVRQDMLKLVDTTSHSVSGPYCTLSYCWGTPSKDPILLTEEHMVSFFASGLNVQDLPRTFRDAVKVCIELGVHYLWIDSLCIIQNDRADWERESRSMHKVYSHGCCNLSATASEDSDGGLFRTRPYDHDQRTRVDIHRADDLIAPGQYIMIETCYADEQIESTPLQTRAWAFQERILSSRNIHFGPTDLVWECNTCIAFERGLSWKLGGNGLLVRSSPKRTAYERHLIDHPYDAVSSTLLDHWCGIQQSYSGRRLTYVGDREIALTGVVSALESGYDQVCTFGLWENHLLAGLVWQRKFNQGSIWDNCLNEGSSNDSEPYAWIPSFSWLAADGAIQPFGQLDLSYGCEMVHYELRNVASVPGLKPHVLLCGQLRQVNIKKSSSEPLDVDVTLERQRDVIFYGASLDRQRQDFDIISKPKGSHFCLPLARIVGSSIVCMLLKIKEQGSTTYRRIGSCWIEQDKFEIFKSRQKNEAKFPCKSYDPKTGKHVIRIE